MVKLDVFLFKDKVNETLSITISEKIQPQFFKSFARKRHLMTYCLTGSQFFNVQLREKSVIVPSKKTHLVKIVSLCSSATADGIFDNGGLFVY